MSWLDKAAQKQQILLNDPLSKITRPPRYKTVTDENLPSPANRPGAFIGHGTNSRGTGVPGAVTESGDQEQNNPLEVVQDGLTSGDGGGRIGQDLTDEDLNGRERARGESNTTPARWERGSATGTNLPNSSSPDTTELDLRNRGEPGQTKDYSPQEGMIHNFDQFADRLRNPRRRAKYKDTDIEVL